MFLRLSFHDLVDHHEMLCEYDALYLVLCTFFNVSYYVKLWLVIGSSSSGRMSMESACSGASLGDSGTHSDPEDRKVNRVF